jgi:hypothetical protein
MASLYYYVSLPFVGILVIGGTAAVFYAFMLIGRIPVQLVFMLAVGALITLYKMIQSLFVRVQPLEAGRALAQEEAPGLWALTREVAGQVGTRPIDAIRLTAGTEVAVYEKGSRRERARDAACRTLVVGAGVLNGFRESAFNTGRR